MTCAVLWLLTAGCAEIPKVGLSNDDDDGGGDDQRTDSTDTGLPGNSGDPKSEPEPEPTPDDDAPEVDLTDPDAVRGVATGISGVGAYGSTVFTVISASGGAAEGGCPGLDVNGNATTFVGDGCVSTSGTRWFGRATLVGWDGIGSSGSVELDDFGYEIDTSCDNGTIIRQQIRQTGELDSDGTNWTAVTTTRGDAIDRVACSTTSFEADLEYSGTLTFIDDNVMIVSGEGRLDDSRFGRVDGATATQVHQLLGECAESDSGQTVLTTSDHEVIITYDGLTDCDSDSRVRWSLDGKPQGELSGVACNTGSLSVSVGCLVLGAVPLLRRRRQRSTASVRAKTVHVIGSA